MIATIEPMIKHLTGEVLVETLLYQLNDHFIRSKMKRKLRTYGIMLERNEIWLVDIVEMSFSGIVSTSVVLESFKGMIYESNECETNRF